jgi:hypothetical protein
MIPSLILLGLAHVLVVGRQHLRHLESSGVEQAGSVGSLSIALLLGTLDQLHVAGGHGLDDLVGRPFVGLDAHPQGGYRRVDR